VEGCRASDRCPFTMGEGSKVNSETICPTAKVACFSITVKFKTASGRRELLFRNFDHINKNAINHCSELTFLCKVVKAYSIAPSEGKCFPLYLSDELIQAECWPSFSLITPIRKSPSHFELGRFWSNSLPCYWF